MKLHPLRIIKVRVVSLFHSGLGIVSKKVKIIMLYSQINVKKEERLG